MIYYINKLKDKKLMIVSIDGGKAFNKIQHTFIVKTFHKIGIEENYLNIIVVVLLLSHVRFFANSWNAAHQASLSFTISWILFKLMSIQSVMPSNHLILCHKKGHI